MTPRLLRSSCFTTFVLLAAFGFALGTPSDASAKAKWSCGEWKKESATKECRTCTRSVCDTKGSKVEDCRVETKTECSQPEGSKAGAATPGGGLGGVIGREIDPGAGPVTLEQPKDPPSPDYGEEVPRISPATCILLGGTISGWRDSWRCCVNEQGSDTMCVSCDAKACRCDFGCGKKHLLDPKRQPIAGMGAAGRATDPGARPQAGPGVCAQCEAACRSLIALPLEYRACLAECRGICGVGDPVRPGGSLERLDSGRTTAPTRGGRERPSEPRPREGRERKDYRDAPSEPRPREGRERKDYRDAPTPAPEWPTVQ